MQRQTEMRQSPTVEHIGEGFMRVQACEDEELTNSIWLLRLDARSLCR